VAAELRRELAAIDWNRYPEAEADQLYAALAKSLGLPREMLLCGNGSDELILLLLLAFGRQQPVFLPTPTFSMYRQSALTVGAELTEFPLTEDFQLDLPRMLPVIGQQEGLIFVCRPNNPTGNSFPEADVLRLLQETRLTVVVDEAYAEFSGRSMLGRVPEQSRLLVLRTLSKAYGLAGIRLGYLVGPAQLISQVDQVRSPYNLNLFTLTAGRVALGQREQLLAAVPRLLAERQWLVEQLSAVSGVRVYPSDTNFLLLGLPGRAPAIWADLHQQGIWVRRLDGRLQADFLRVTVGRRAENLRFLAALQESLRSGESA
jgi:histidinol-phosphate aminotransferase